VALGEVALDRLVAALLGVEVERSGILVVLELLAVPGEAERLVGEDVGVGLGAQPDRPTEVIGVAVGDHRRVHVVDLVAGAAQAIDECVPGVLARQARIHDGDAVLVLHHVAVDVAEPRHRDRQLRAQDPGSDFDDVGRCVLLLLLRGPRCGLVRPVGDGVGVGVGMVVLRHLVAFLAQLCRAERSRDDSDGENGRHTLRRRQPSVASRRAARTPASLRRRNGAATVGSDAFRHAPDEGAVAAVPEVRGSPGTDLCPAKAPVRGPRGSGRGAMNLGSQTRRIVHAFRLKPWRVGSRRFGYLHVAKAGGISTQALLGRLNHLGHRTPTMFGHYWTLDDITIRYPRMRVALVIRDPLERMVSGFNSVRRGGPQGTRLWTPAEAATFAMFPTIDTLLSAICSDDPADQVAARTAMRSIVHLRFGYVHHFGSPGQLERTRHRLYCVGHVNRLDDFHVRLLEPLGVDAETVRRHSTIEHVADRPTTRWIDELDRESRHRMRAVLAREYEIYDYLGGLTCSPP
jgi:hypothetical protein